MKNKMNSNSRNAHNKGLDQNKIANEKDLQRVIRYVLRDPNRQWRTTSGALLSVISVGEWNHHEGPDFLNMALQVEGAVVVGHGEVHWRSSDWESHHHEKNPLYDGLMLHIVLHDNRAETPFAHYTLVMPEEIVLLNTHSSMTVSQGIFQSDLHDVLRDYATQRFLRKARYAGTILALHDANVVFMSLLSDFLQRRLSKQHLPNGLKKIARALENVDNQAFAPLLHFIVIAPTLSNPTACVNAAENALAECLVTAQCGRGTALEIVVNIVLPLSYAYCVHLQRTDSAQNLLCSYVHIPAANQYAHLKRKFPTIAQEYVWQQQGMLEYELEIGAPAKKEQSTIHAIAAHQTRDMVITFYTA